MDPARRLFDHLRLEPVGGWAWRSIEHHCGHLRVDRRYFVPDQPLISSRSKGTVKTVPFERLKLLMLKFVLLMAMLLWIYGFFGHSDSGGKYRSAGIYFLSIAIIGLIIIGFLS